MNGTELGTQAFIHDEEPRPERFDPPTNTESPVHKPDGGLWTSTLRADGSCAWLDWWRSHDWDLWEGATLYALEPEANLSVLEIDSEADFQRALAEWEREDRLVRGPFDRKLDFEAMADEYDAIHLTETGRLETRFITPGLYSWDCECTLWLRWSFRSVETRGPVTTESQG